MRREEVEGIEGDVSQNPEEDGYPEEEPGELRMGENHGQTAPAQSQQDIGDEDVSDNRREQNKERVHGEGLCRVAVDQMIESARDAAARTVEARRSLKRAGRIEAGGDGVEETQEEQAQNRAARVEKRSAALARAGFDCRSGYNLCCAHLYALSLPLKASTSRRRGT